MTILSKKNPRVQAARKLVRDAGERAAQGVFVLEGPKLVGEALDAKLPIREAYVVAADAKGPKGLDRALIAAGAELLEVDAKTLADLASVESAQGIVAIAELPKHRGVEGLVAGAGDLLLVAGVQDPGNAGALVRIAAAAGFAGVIADRATADFFSPKAVRGSAGSVLRLPAFRVDDLAAVARDLSAKGVAVLGAAPRGGEDPSSLKLPPRAALVVGAEGRGIPPALEKACTKRVTIPMAPGIESLNVAAAAAVLTFSLRTRRQKVPGTTN